MQTLIIVEWFGEESLGRYLVPDAPDWVLKCHQQYGGTGNLDRDVMSLLMMVMDAICAEPKYYNDPSHELAGAWVKYKLGYDSTSVPVTGDELRVVVTGWVP